MAVAKEALPLFDAMCVRERCPYAVVGVATDARALVVGAIDPHAAPSPADDRAAPIDMPLGVLLGKPPKMHRDVRRRPVALPPLDLSDVELGKVAFDVLRHPTVASKRFLITIGDRTVGGLSCRDPMVGPWQVPVADCAITLADFSGVAGEAMAMGERTPLAVVDAPASGRMAVGEAITNLLAAPIALDRVKLQLQLDGRVQRRSGGAGRRRCALRHGQGGRHGTVPGARHRCSRRQGQPVDADALAGRGRHREAGDGAGEPRRHGVRRRSRACDDDCPHICIRRSRSSSTATPRCILVDLGGGRMRMGGSMLAQVTGQFGAGVPDLDDPQLLKALVDGVTRLRDAGVLLAYHDRSDGGLWAAACEMAFAGHRGVSLNVDLLVTRRRRHRRLAAPSTATRRTGPPGRARGAGREPSAARAVLNEELGAIDPDSPGRRHGRDAGHADPARRRPEQAQSCRRQDPHARGRRGLARCEVGIQRATLRDLHQAWDEVSWRICRLRDNPECADAEHEAAGRADDPGLHVHLAGPAFDPARPQAPALVGSAPKVAVLREQGVNSHVELSYAMSQAGFDTYDVHMTDLQSGRRPAWPTCTRASSPAAASATATRSAPAKGGRARSVSTPSSPTSSRPFFGRPDVFALGICNGCQMLAALADMIPGAAAWPRFTRNRSEQFEARLSLVEVLPSPSIFFGDMAGSRLPIAVAHGEGYADYTQRGDAARVRTR